ncbi:hypothetical protein T01_11243 [Trichinella spiralis]|uniref:Uncharacterized protein n=1 Tax=Trichinella spiralis TaxID=6334 RepID=A0A0V1B0Z4_TRISP|nr:hypothetical protein T01_11243 [Trichinella spiralis]
MQCGNAREYASLISYLTIFTGFHENKYYKDCMGTILPQWTNSTHTDIFQYDQHFKLYFRKVGETKVMLAPSLLQFSAGDGSYIKKFITPKDYQNAELARTPFNFAIVKLNRPIKVSQFNKPVCLPTDPSDSISAQPCFVPRIHYNILTSYGNAYIMVLQSFSYCRRHNKRILPGRHFCAKFLMPFAPANNDMTADMLLEGAPLLCIKDGLIYQFGIFDWIKISNNQDTHYPVAFFSATFNITPIINEVTKENFTNRHFDIKDMIGLYDILL